MSDKRRYKWYRQRKKWGFDDRDTWSLDLSIAKFALPRLKRFKEVTIGYPGCLKSMKEWHEILDKIIYAMEIRSDDEKWNSADTDQQKVEEGCKLFGEWFSALWW